MVYGGATHCLHHSTVQSDKGELSPLLYNIYTNHLLSTFFGLIVVGEFVGGTWVNSPSCADDVVFLAPTFTALETLVDVCHAYAGPHDIFYKTMKTACVLGNDEFCCVEEFGTLEMPLLQNVVMMKMENNSG